MLVPREALIKLARADRGGFFRHKEAQNRRNTVCISGLSNEFAVEEDQRLPKTNLISGSLVIAFMLHKSLFLMTRSTF